MIKARIVFTCESNVIEDIVGRYHLTPQKTWAKGDKIGSSLLKFKHFGCSFEIEKEVATNINDIAKSVIDSYGSQIRNITNILDENGIERELSIIVISENIREITLFISKDVLHFCFDMSLEIDIDLV